MASEQNNIDLLSHITDSQEQRFSEHKRMKISKIYKFFANNASALLQMGHYCTWVNKLCLKNSKTVTCH
ncbi:hypothetical protein BDQ17DRAFT_1363838, partial [Cyathus striatus]